MSHNDFIVAFALSEAGLEGIALAKDHPEHDLAESILDAFHIAHIFAHGPDNPCVSEGGSQCALLTKRDQMLSLSKRISAHQISIGTKGARNDQA